MQRRAAIVTPARRVALPGPAAAHVHDRAELLPERRAALERWAEWPGRLREDQEHLGQKILPGRWWVALSRIGARRVLESGRKPPACADDRRLG
jgi:hypothetical protein